MQKKHSRAYKPRAFPEGYGIFNNQVRHAGAELAGAARQGALSGHVLCAQN